MVSSRPHSPLQPSQGVCSGTERLTGSQAATAVGRTPVGRLRGRDFEGGSWLLDETRQSPGWPGVLHSHFY